MYFIEDLIKKREFNKNTDKILECLRNISKRKGYEKYYQDVLSKILNFSLKQNNEKVINFCLNDLKHIKRFHLKSVIYSKNINLIKKIYGIYESRYMGVSPELIEMSIKLMIKKRMEAEIIDFIDFLKKNIPLPFSHIIKRLSKDIIVYKMNLLLKYMYSNNLYENNIILNDLIEKLDNNISYLRENDIVNSELINKILSAHLSMNVKINEYFIDKLVTEYKSDFDLDSEVLKRYINSNKIQNSVLFNIEFIRKIRVELENLYKKEKSKKKENQKTILKLEQLLLKLNIQDF